MSLSEMLAMREKMDAQLRELERTGRQEALLQVQQLVKQYGFLSYEVYARPEEAKTKVADKYYDPDTGLSWSGRGKPPRWIQDKDRTQFLISKQVTYDPDVAKTTGLLGALNAQK